MAFFQDFAVAEIHVHAAWQAGIEAAHGAHDVDAFEFVSGSILFENRRVLHRVFIRPRSAVDVARIAVPRRRRIRMIVGDLAVANHHVMGQHAAHRFGETAADRIFGNLERLPRLGVAGAHFFQRLFDEIQRSSRRVCLEIGARPVALDGVAPLAESSTRNVPRAWSRSSGRLKSRWCPVAFT